MIKTSTAQNILLLLGAIMSFIVAYLGLLRPEQILDGVDVVIDTPSGRNEIRAMYGGMQLLIGVYALLAFFDKVSKYFALVLMLIVVGGIFLGRLLSLAFEGMSIFTLYTPVLQSLYVLEFILVCLYAWAVLHCYRDENKNNK